MFNREILRFLSRCCRQHMTLFFVQEAFSYSLRSQRNPLLFQDSKKGVNILVGNYRGSLSLSVKEDETGSLHTNPGSYTEERRRRKEG